MRDVLEVRKALEELAVQLACEKITDEEIEEMKKAAEEFKMILKARISQRLRKPMYVFMISFTWQRIIRN